MGSSMSHARFARDRSEVRGLRAIYTHIYVYTLVYTHVCMYLHRYIVYFVSVWGHVLPVPLLRSIVHLSSMSVVSWANWRVVCCFYTFPCSAFCLRSNFTALQAGRKRRQRGDNGLEMEMVLQIDEGVAQWAHWAAGVFGHLQLNLNTDNN